MTKKILLPLVVVAACVGFVIYGRFKSTSNGASAPVATVPVTVVASSSQSAQYKDGTYTGSVADAYYGNVQVQAVIKNGAVSDVQFLQYPNENGNTLAVSRMSMPLLISEAIKTQNANVNIVSGATQTSQAFQQSLSAALSQAS